MQTARRLYSTAAQDQVDNATYINTLGVTAGGLRGVPPGTGSPEAAATVAHINGQGMVADRSLSTACLGCT